MAPTEEKSLQHQEVTTFFESSALSKETEDVLNGADERLEKLRQDHEATWDSPNDPHDPYNWSTFRKMTIGILISLGQLIAFMSASVIAPALGDIAKDLHTSASTAQIIMTTTFLGFAFGPFLFNAVSEVYGRRLVWIFGNAWFILWNALCPVGKTQGSMIFARLMAGAGASVSISLAQPVMADLYREKDRGKSMAIVAALTYLGPAIGPIVGGLVTQLIRWEWIFGIISLLNTLVTIVGIVCLEETYTPVLLRRKAKVQNEFPPMQKTSARKCQSWRDIHVHPKLSESLLRPLRLFWTRPIIYLIATILAVDMGVYTLMLSTLSTLWIQKYNQSEFTSSLHYIAVAIGATINGQLGSYTMDRLYAFFSTRSNNNVGKPEFRIPYLVPGLILMPAGLLWYGWAAERSISWIVVDFGVVVFTLGSFTTAQAMYAYQVDEFETYNASAMAASCLLQNVLGFVLPIFAPQLYEKKGYGLGNSLVAVGMVGIGFPVCIVLWFWGDRVRTYGKMPKRRGQNESASTESDSLGST
ncbi:hypothetical protein N0V90_000258 [Kalmusia sp. IMI 367209]|nr:hypothetical protein N0V90_000258 [Kalmusia sp. IMI 367209]